MVFTAIYIKYKNCTTNQAARSQNSGYASVGGCCWKGLGGADNIPFVDQGAG